MSGIVKPAYSTLELITWTLVEGSTFLLLTPVVLLVLVARDGGIRIAPMTTALRALPRALAMASVLIIAALAALRFGHVLHVGGVLDFLIGALLLLAPHLLVGAILLPLVCFYSRRYTAGPAIGGLASVPVILLALFQHSLIGNFS